LIVPKQTHSTLQDLKKYNTLVYFSSLQQSKSHGCRLRQNGTYGIKQSGLDQGSAGCGQYQDVRGPNTKDLGRDQAPANVRAVRTRAHTECAPGQGHID